LEHLVRLVQQGSHNKMTAIRHIEARRTLQHRTKRALQAMDSFRCCTQMLCLRRLVAMLSVARANWSQTAKAADRESICAAAHFAKLRLKFPLEKNAFRPCFSGFA
jgi:hypothetical protein